MLLVEVSIHRATLENNVSSSKKAEAAQMLGPSSVRQEVLVCTCSPGAKDKDIHSRKENNPLSEEGNTVPFSGQ